MRVAQLLCAGRFAGAESVACSLASALGPHVEQSLLYLVVETRAEPAGRAELLQRVRSLNVESRIFETDRRLSWSLLRRLQAAFRADRLDVVHSHSYKAAFLAPIIRRFDPRVAPAIAFTLHGIDLPPSWGLAFLGAVNAAGALGSDVLIACSQPIACSYRRWPLLASKTRLLQNALPPGFIPQLDAMRARREQRRAALAEVYRLDLNAVWVAIVGRLVAVKDHDLLLRALSRLRGTGQHHQRPIQLIVAGDGPLAAPLEQRAREIGVAEQVVFVGQLSDLAVLYGAVDLLTLTSRSEGSPMVILEAMAYGLPVVATRVGGIADQVVEGQTALLVPPGDEEALAGALGRLAGDDALRTALGDAGHQRVITQFDPEGWARRHLQIYEEQLTR